MPRLQKALMLTDKGYKDLKRATAACTLTNFSLMLPFGISLQIIMEIIKPLDGGEYSAGKLWLLFGAGLVSAIIVFLCHKNDYKKTYVASYNESENVRVAIAEHIRKLPMSLFNSKDLTELTTNFMGERQRISIARALLKDAPIVLLDEATASLDPENEASIQRAISTLIQGKTVIVIAHRLRTVIGADTIVVLDKGRPVEMGSSAELLAKDGLFARLYAIQQESMAWGVGGG